jgi:mono/diheme cytochrome c family protein
MQRPAPWLLAALGLAGPALAQAGDAKDPGGTVQADPPASMQIPDAPVLGPVEALAAFTVEPGYRLELVAGEPLVQDPVSIRFDALGRLWVVEMRGYMPDADGRGEDQPVGCVAILEDRDGDGLMDHRTDYLDRLAMPRAVLPLGDGEALVLAPPWFLHARDLDGDLVADERTPIGLEFDNGFTDPEHAANAPTFGLDNWIHLARYDRRLRLRDGAWESAPTAFGGQWGLGMDDAGGLWFNTNSDHLRAHLAPPGYAVRHPGLDGPAFANQRIGPRQDVWPIRVTPGVNRGYQKGTLREDGRLRTFTAVCAPLVYRGDRMPELRGDVFVAEPAAHLIRRDVLTVDGTTARAANAYPDREFVASTDERFRPVDLQNGPDGALYVVDMYRGLIQHRNYLTSYLRRQVDRRGLAAPIHMGRIWRIVPDRSGERPAWKTVPDLAAAVAGLADPNGWVRDTAQRELVRQPAAAREQLPAIRALARTAIEAPVRLHALWTLDGLAALDRATVLHGIRDADPTVREHAVRLAEAWLGAARVDPLVLGLVARLAHEEHEPRVAMQLAFSLGAVEAGEPAFRARAEDALFALLLRRADDPRLRDAVVSGLAGVEVGFAQRLSGEPGFADERPGRGELLARLARCVFRGRQDGSMRALLGLAAEVGRAWQRRALLGGVAAALPRPGTRKLAMAGRPAALQRLAALGEAEVAEVLARIEEAVDFDAASGVRALEPAEQARFDAGASAYARHCTPCHQPHGQGLAGLAPPLVGSEWVLGPPERLARIVLQGMTGPVDVAGQRYEFALMPDHGKLGDAEVAAILTYVRRAWENEAEPVDETTVAAVRAERRTTPWTAAELR